jgi:site-specific recombinase XerD
VSLYEGTKHALGTAMKAAGVDNRVIADLFGHSDAGSVLPYGTVQTTVVRNALGKLKSDSL